MSDTVTITPTSIEGSDSADWKIKGTATVKGDTYEVVYDYTYGEYGGSSTDYFLDGVKQDRDTYIERDDLGVLIGDEISGVLWDWLRTVRTYADGLWDRKYGSTPFVVAMEEE